VKRLIPPPILALIAAVVMWALNRWLPLVLLFEAPWYRLAVVPVVLGVVIASVAFETFRRVRTTVDPRDPAKATYLVRQGVFSFTRNPMYVGLLLVLIGWGVWLQSASVWIVPPLFWMIITYGQIAAEERALHRLFGDSYTEYCREVPRWVGRRKAPVKQTLD
jgi:protein-S-isoprenylcysteine O-methyltransferase Ste14